MTRFQTIRPTLACLVCTLVVSPAALAANSHSPAVHAKQVARHAVYSTALAGAVVGNEPRTTAPFDVSIASRDTQTWLGTRP
jgi:hypothetical protein